VVRTVHISTDNICNVVLPRMAIPVSDVAVLIQAKMPLAFTAVLAKIFGFSVISAWEKTSLPALESKRKSHGSCFIVCV